MDFKFNVSGMMNVDVSKYKVYNETRDGIFELEHDNKLYNLVVAVEVFDMETKEISYIVNDNNLRDNGFEIYDYADIQWEVDYEKSENSSEGLSVDQLV